MISLVLAFHNHQPVGNFEWVFEEAYGRAYRPLMEILGSFRTIRFAQHYTGILLDWFAANHPDFLEMIGAGVRAERVELLSGGYYEPIMAMLPERDRRAQIERLNRRIERSFETRPTGMWLAERVWEPSIPATAAPLGMRYTFLDDTHFRSAGLQDREIRGYFLTEDQGMPMAILPIDKRLRYTIPFEAPEVTIDYLRSLNRQGEDRVVVFADDGEKFGIWPHTYRTVYDEEWLLRFCRLLEKNGSWLRTITPGDVIRSIPPVGRLYLPTASYAEMLHWALPSPEAFMEFEAFERALQEEKLFERYGSFVRGGFWRNFLVKYPEINAMQKKMLRLSKRIERALTRHDDDPAKREIVDGAYGHLLASQCNCPYWHGVFGGIYLSNIRARVYSEMIEAEGMLDRLEEIQGRTVFEDYDLDGRDEVIYENGEIALYIAPAQGGTIFEFDYKPLRYNFTNLVARRREGYHGRLLKVAVEGEEEGGDDEARSIHDIVRVKEKHLDRALVYDPWRRAILRDHFFSTRPTARGLVQGTLRDHGDFADGIYDVYHTKEDRTSVIVLERNGHVGRRPVALRKTIRIDDESSLLRIEYALRALDGIPLRGRFGVEMAYTLSAGTEPDRYYLIDGARTKEKGGRLNGPGESRGGTIALVDEWLGARIGLRLASPALLVRAPVETVSLSEDGFERNYQGSVVMPIWDLEDVEWEMTIEQSVERI